MKIRQKNHFLMLIIPFALLAICSNVYGGHGKHCLLNDPILTDAGYVSGTVMDAIYVQGVTGIGEPYDALIGEIGDKVRIYRGIPYAAPPVGELRWKPPQPIEPWDYIRECTHFSPMAPQPWPASSVYGSIPEEGMSEDCLYLNVTTPAKSAGSRLPVMVLFHGGGLQIGSVNRFSDNSPPLAQHGVVSVTVNHRIGPFGYMAHPELSDESPNGASGNYGQLDLITALQWVQRNISAFGGDPNNVTIWGHSGGGSKTNFTLASPLSKGLFHRAICEAGFSTGGTSLVVAEQYGLNLMDAVGVANIAEMREKSWQEIILASVAPGTGYFTVHTVDGWSLPDTIGNIFAAGQNHDVPYMVGMGGGEIRSTTPLMGQLLQTMSAQQKSPIYTYVFTHVPRNWADAGAYAFHGLEVSYQYGVIDTVQRLYGTALMPASPEVNPDPGLDERDYWLTDEVMTMWTRFAANGSPTRIGKKHNRCCEREFWPPYDEKDRYLDIGVPIEVNSGFSTLTEFLPPR